MNADMTAVWQYLQSRQNVWFKLLGSFVAIDSSQAHNPTAINAVGQTMRAHLSPFEYQSITHETPVGNIWQYIKAHPQRPRILLLGHADVVLAPSGTLVYHDDAPHNRIQGSGTLDMKGGLVYMAALAECLQTFHWPATLTLMIVPDEETGSTHSSKVIAEVASKHDYCIVLEGSETLEHITRSRKTGSKQALIFSRIDQKFYPALAMVIKASHDLTDFNAGLTASPLASLSTQNWPRSNIVPDLASVYFRLELRDATMWSTLQSGFMKAAHAPELPGSRLQLDLLKRESHYFDYHLTVHGKKSHAGNNLHEGVNAWVELSNRILALDAWSRAQKQVTLSWQGLDQIFSGAVPDVRLQIDMRANTDADLNQRLHMPLENIIKESGAGAYLPGPFTPAKADRPAMPPSPVFDPLIAAIAAGHNIPLETLHKGGMSDGNISAGAGCPTTDGWGPIGQGMHTYDEHIHRDQFLTKLKMTADLLYRLIKQHAT
jgi:glutamate carboxypeptidase